MVKGRTIDITRDLATDPLIDLLGKESERINEQQGLEETCVNALRDRLPIGGR